jgi:hypothetical protein
VPNGFPPVFVPVKNGSLVLVLPVSVLLLSPGIEFKLSVLDEATAGSAVGIATLLEVKGNIVGMPYHHQ